jgi:hypothetical protein
MPNSSSESYRTSLATTQESAASTCGSRAKGFETPESDYDCYIVVTDEARSEMAHLERRSAEMDIGVFSMSEFGAHAAIGSLNAWDRYNFAHGKVLIDKTGGAVLHQQALNTTRRERLDEDDQVVRVTYSRA